MHTSQDSYDRAIALTDLNTVEQECRDLTTVLDEMQSEVDDFIASPAEPDTLPPNVPAIYTIRLHVHYNALNNYAAMVEFASKACSSASSPKIPPSIIKDVELRSTRAIETYNRTTKAAAVRFSILSHRFRNHQHIITLREARVTVERLTTDMCLFIIRYQWTSQAVIPGQVQTVSLHQSSSLLYLNNALKDSRTRANHLSTINAAAANITGAAHMWIARLEAVQNAQTNYARSSEAALNPDHKLSEPDVEQTLAALYSICATADVVGETWRLLSANHYGGLSVLLRMHAGYALVLDPKLPRGVDGGQLKSLEDASASFQECLSPVLPATDSCGSFKDKLEYAQQAGRQALVQSFEGLVTIDVVVHGAMAELRSMVLPE